MEIFIPMVLKVDLLETSLAQLSDRKTEFTDYFYSTLFSDYPQVQPLFKNTSMNEQAKKLFASLVLIVNNLKKPQALTATLKDLGTRHIEYGVFPEHYPMVGSTLLKSMSATLKDRWTPELAAVWTEAYSAITKIILDEADYPQNILDLESPISKSKAQTQDLK